MIISKEIEIHGRILIQHESDRGKMIRQVETDIEYAVAIDVIPCRYTYEETDKDIEMPEMPRGEQDETEN